MHVIPTSCFQLDKSQAELISCILNPPSMKDSSYEPPGKTSKKSSNGLSSLQVSTVDAFQGAEKSIILLSTVRSQHPGFIDDARRINVALTRAQRHLLIFGTKELLEGIRTWGKVMQRLTTKGKDFILKNTS
jgi:superfamily I DNA and/or RNA helicase